MNNNKFSNKKHKIFTKYQKLALIYTNINAMGQFDW